MQYSDAKFNGISIEVHTGSDKKLMRNWEKVDLKDLLAILALANPPITQTKVAQMLKISPVTLSRLVNSNDHRIRKAWIPTLSECLSEVDLERVSATANALRTINEHIVYQKFLIEMVPVIEKYISKRGLGYKVDLEYWGLSDGIIRFYDAEEESQWLISLGLRRDAEDWRFIRSGLGPFARYRRMQSITANDRISVLYCNAEWFSASVKMSKYRQINQHLYKNGVNLPCYQSLLLCDSQGNQIEEEYVLVSSGDDML